MITEKDIECLEELLEKRIKQIHPEAEEAHLIMMQKDFEPLTSLLSLAKQVLSASGELLENPYPKDIFIGKQFELANHVLEGIQKLIAEKAIK